MHTLVLAAGRGSRFGNGSIGNESLGDVPKQLATIAGQSMLQRSVNLAQSITPEKVTVVLGYQHALLQSQINDAQVVINPEWQSGLSSSIACGLAALPSSASAVLIYLCDQVAITKADLEGLWTCYENLVSTGNSAIVCAAYEGGVGVPAIFPRAYFSQLSALTGDKGAKQLLQQALVLQTSPVVTVPLANAAIDIDTYEQWEQWAERESKLPLPLGRLHGCSR